MAQGLKAISTNAIQYNVAMIDVSHYISICISLMTRVLLHEVRCFLDKIGSLYRNLSQYNQQITHQSLFEVIKIKVRE